MKQGHYIIVNGITVYRIVIAPFLFYLVLKEDFSLFRWLLAFSFFTDMLDGFLARLWNVSSRMGSRLDSIGDDLTVLVGVYGLYVFKHEIIFDHLYLFILLFALYIVQNACALIKFGKATSFHTWLAKLGALFQGVFLILTFFTEKPLLGLFYWAIFITALELIEEIALVFLLPKWENNVRGIYWVLKNKNVQQNQNKT